MTFKGFLSSAISIIESDTINIEHCTVSKTYNYGIELNNDKNCTVRSCHIYDTGVGGINVVYVGEMEKYNDSTLESNNILIENCEINDYARVVKTYSPAVAISGNGTVVRNCKIYGADHYAISLGGNDSVVENCEIFDVLRTVDDSGAIYAGKTKENRGLVVHNNYFHDIYSSSTSSGGIFAIYMDDLKDGCTTDGNLFVNLGGTAMFVNGGRDNAMTNNISINLARNFLLTARGKRTSADIAGYLDIKTFSFPKYINNKAYEKYPHFSILDKDDWNAPKYNVVKNNVLINTKLDYVYSIDVKTSSTTPEIVAADNDINASTVITSDPGFVNSEIGNYALKLDSVIYDTIPKEGAPDLMQMGLITSHLKNRLGSSLSFLAGSPKMYDGFKAELIDSDANMTPIISDGKF